MNREKDIVWYEWLYKITNEWNVTGYLYNKELKQHNNWCWYLYVTLYKWWKHRNHYIHRLVAECFHLKTDRCVNHKDWNKLNNNYNNLERCTYSENQLHSHRILWNKSSTYWVFWKNNKHSIEINQYSLEWEFIKTRECAEEVKRKLNIDQSCVIKCCRWKRHKAWGYRWEYK